MYLYLINFECPQIKPEPLDIDDDVDLDSLFTESGDFIINQ